MSNDQDASGWVPLSLTRELSSFAIGNRSLADHQQSWASSHGLTVAPQAWLAADDLQEFASSEAQTLADERGVPLAWRKGGSDEPELFRGKHSFLIRHSWDLLRANEQQVGGLSKSDFRGEVHPSAVIEGIVHIGKGTRILPGVLIEGNVVIGENCKIGPNCYLRGNTSIGDSCHIGQAVEIKNCLILSSTNVGHLSYIGDSILGEKVNLGAGTIVSNLRHDGKNHRSMVRGELVDTGRRKFGTVIGDGVHTGIHTSIYPGRKLWPGTSTRPGDIVQHDLIS